MKSPWAWPKEHDEYIIKNIATQSYEKMGHVLGKPRSTISDRAKKLGLSRPGTHSEATTAKRVASREIRYKKRGLELMAAGNPQWPQITASDETAYGGRRYDDAPASLRNMLGNGSLVMISRRAAFRYEGSACGNSSQLCAP